MMDPQDPTEVRTVLLCHVHDLVVAGSSSNRVKLSAHLIRSFKTNLVRELIRYSDSIFVRDWEKVT